MLTRPGFTVVRMRQGYAATEVDAVVERVMATLDGRAPVPVSAEEVARARFTPVRIRAGYDISEVDSWLDRAAAALAGGTAPDDGATAPMAASNPVQPAVPPPTPEADHRWLHGPRTAIVLPALLVLALLAWWLTR